MRNRASLLLMEQLIMVLVFALAASLCLQCFASATAISQETACYDNAVTLAQNAAEAVKACAGDLNSAARLLQGQSDGAVLTVMDQNTQLEVTLLDSGQPGLGQAQIRVADEAKCLYTLTVSWQEVTQ